VQKKAEIKSIISLQFLDLGWAIVDTPGTTSAKKKISLIKLWFY